VVGYTNSARGFSEGTTVKTVRVAAAICALLALAGCQTGNVAAPAGKVVAAIPGDSDDTDQASQRYTGLAHEPTRFGERRISANGLSITVSSPRLFTPSEIAFPPSPRAVAFSITIDNNGKDAYSPTELVVTAFAGGDTLKQVADAKQGYMGMARAADDVPPGKTMRLTVAYAVPAETVTIIVRVEPMADSLEPLEYTGTV
jgi:hypothetical protein